MIHEPVQAVSLKIASTMMFVLMGAQARYLGSVFPVGEIIFFRGLFALIPIVLDHVIPGHGRIFAGANRETRQV